MNIIKIIWNWIKEGILGGKSEDVFYILIVVSCLLQYVFESQLVFGIALILISLVFLLRICIRIVRIKKFKYIQLNHEGDIWDKEDTV